MSRTFRPHGDGVRMQLELFEVDLLVSLRDALHDTLSGDDPDQRVLERLFPAAVGGDAEADAELRAMLHEDLLQSRLDGLDALVRLLERGSRHRGSLRVDLEEDEPALVLGVLNDLRLALGARIGIERLDRDGLAPDDPVQHRLAIMDHLAWWQEQLLAIIDPPSVTHYGDV